jgi:ABC-2 type transport system permease protein
MLRPVLALARAEVLHVVRDRATLTQVLLVPIVQLLVLSNAATFAIRDTPMYAVDLDRSAVSRGLLTRFAASGHFRIVGQSASTDLANDALLRGDVTMTLTVPAGFEKALVRTGTAPVQVSLNAEKGTAAGIVQAYAGSILSAYSRELAPALRPSAQTVAATGDAGRRASPMPGSARIELRTRSWYNPTLDYRHYMVPGILVGLITIISTLLAAQNVAREKELGTLEQLNVTPITRGQFITAKLLPFWVLAMFDLGLGLVVGRLVFGVPMEGSLLLLFAAAAVYLIVTLGIGLLISTAVDTQQQAMFVAFFVVMIYLLMSGLFTPVDSMPLWVRPVTELNPVRHFVAIARAVLIRGAGLAEVARPLGMLTGFAVIVFTVAVRQYAKRTA